MEKKLLDQYDEGVKRLSDIVSKMGTREACKLGLPKIFKIAGGEAHVWLLHERPTVSIVKSYVTPGASFPRHSHMAKEVITIFEGAAIYRSQGVMINMIPGDVVEVEPELPHSVEAGKEGAWFSVTTVPREEGLWDV